MTQPAPTPWASPHGAGNIPAGPPPAPHYPPPYPSIPVRPPSKGKRRGGLLALAIALPLALIVGTVVVIVTLTSGNKVVSDPTNRIAMTVPKTWSNDTTDDAGQWVEQGEDSYAVPDLEVSGFGGLVTVLIADRADTSLTEVHEAEVEEACDVIGCLSHGQRVEMDVNGRRGLEQVLRHRDDEVTILMTIESNTLVVNLAGETWAPPGDRDVEKLTAVMHTLTVHR